MALDLVAAGESEYGGRVVHNPPESLCPVCGDRVADLAAHCAVAGDPQHLAASVMET